MATAETRTRRITVVVSTVDRPVLLARCLAALDAGTRGPDEVVVVDQGHGAETERVLGAARARGLPIVHVRQSGHGLSVSQNEGVRRAGSGVVAIVDDDCVPAPGWLATVERAFATAPGPLLLTGRVMPLPPAGARVAAVSSRRGSEPRTWSRPPMPWLLGTGGNFAVDRASFLAVGGNDERLGAGSPGRGANDLDLFDRLVAAGATARFEPGLLVEHERSTVAEHRSRRGSYGFGVGAMTGLWLRRRERRALPVLAGWLRLRLRRVWRQRSVAVTADEVRVLAGTAAGLAHGLRVGARRGPGRG